MDFEALLSKIAIGEELALSFAFLLFLPTRGGCLRGGGLDPYVILVSGEVNDPRRSHLLPCADPLTTSDIGRLVRLTFLESLKDICFLLLLLLLLIVLLLLSD